MDSSKADNPQRATDRCSGTGKKRIFISCSEERAAFVKEMVKWQEGNDLNDEIWIWYQHDEWGIKEGEDIIAWMNKNLKDSDKFIIIYGKESYPDNPPSKRTQYREINYIQNSDKDIYVIKMDNAVLPPLLETRQYVHKDNPELFNKIAQFSSVYESIHYAKVFSSDNASRNPFRFLRAEEFDKEKVSPKDRYVAPERANNSIYGAHPTIFEGPRGTGKSMILLSLRARYQPKNEKIKHFGFYNKISSGAFAKLASTKPENIESEDIIDDLYEKNIILSLIMSFLEEIKEVIDVDKTNKEEINKFSIKVNKIITLQSEENINLDSLIDKIANQKNKIVDYARRKFIHKDNNISLSDVCVYLDSLKQVIQAARNNFTYLSESLFFILIDEYENLKETEQEIINTLIKEAGENTSIKIARKIGSDYSKNTRDGCDIEDRNDYTKISLVYEDGSEYVKFIKEITKTLLIKEGFNITNIEDVLPPFSDIEVDENTLNEKLSHTFSSYRREEYELAATFRSLKPNQLKRYAGYEDIASISSGIIRYFQEIMGMAYYYQYGYDTPEKEAPVCISPVCQKKAVHYISQHNFEAIERIQYHGLLLRQFVLELGEIVKARLLGHKSEPEGARIAITDPLNLGKEEYKTLGDIIEAGIKGYIFSDVKSYKPKSANSNRARDIGICKILAPYLQISHRLRWRTDFNCEELLCLIKNPSKIKRTLIEKHRQYNRHEQHLEDGGFFDKKKNENT